MSDEYPSRTLGKRESRLLSSLSAAGYTVFTIEDARAVLDDSDANVRKILHRLSRKRWIRRLQRGKYLILPLAAGPEAQWAEHEYLIAASLVEPYYLAYATALHYYGYSERPLNPVVIATTRRKHPVTIEGLTYSLVTISLAEPNTLLASLSVVHSTPRLAPGLMVHHVQRYPARNLAALEPSGKDHFLCH